MPDHFAFPRSLIDAGEMFFQTAFKQWPVRNVDEIFRHEPEWFFGCHPIAAIEAPEIHGLRIPAQSPFAAEVEINVKITERQFAQCPINRLAITATGEV